MEAFFQWYAIFCITTCICMLYLQIRAVSESTIRLTFKGWVIYLSLNIGINLFMAPLHFFVFIMNAELYFESLVASMNETEEDENIS